MAKRQPDETQPKSYGNPFTVHTKHQIPIATKGLRFIIFNVERFNEDYSHNR
jgi:hypothetical protein